MAFDFRKVFGIRPTEKFKIGEEGMIWDSPVVNLEIASEEDENDVIAYIFTDRGIKSERRAKLIAMSPLLLDALKLAYHAIIQNGHLRQSKTKLIKDLEYLLREVTK